MQLSCVKSGFIWYRHKGSGAALVPQELVHGMEQEPREVPLTSSISSCLNWGKRSVGTGRANELKYN